MSDEGRASPMDTWLAYNPDKTAGDWAELIRQARERQRLCRERRRRRETGGDGS